MPSPLTLSRLVDLSVGTPEVGAVNFNALHKLLHAIVKSLNVSDVEVDVDEVFQLSQDLASTVDDDGEGDAKWKTVEILQQQVANLENDLSIFNTKLPSVKEMAELINSEKPIADLWQLLALTKKVEANEKAVKVVSVFYMHIVHTLILIQFRACGDRAGAGNLWLLSSSSSLPSCWWLVNSCLVMLCIMFYFAIYTRPVT